MAVDTRQKRMSMVNFGEFDVVLFEADGTVEADDMYHLLGLYAGITLDEPAADTSKPIFIYGLNLNLSGYRSLTQRVPTYGRSMCSLLTELLADQFLPKLKSLSLLMRRLIHPQQCSPTMN